ILEEIRLLTNLETTQDKLLQVLLVGQPELDEKLDSADLRQLKQRIAHRCQLAALDLGETRGYIERRLQVAGLSLNGDALFPSDTIEGVYRHSRGIPRLINTICENALITAYAQQRRSVTPEIIEGVTADLRLNLNVAQPQREGAPGELNETDVQRAAKNLLDLYAYLSRLSSSRDGELRTPLTIRSQQT